MSKHRQEEPLRRNEIFPDSEISVFFLNLFPVSEISDINSTLTDREKLSRAIHPHLYLRRQDIRQGRHIHRHCDGRRNLPFPSEPSGTKAHSYKRIIFSDIRRFILPEEHYSVLTSSLPGNSSREDGSHSRQPGYPHRFSLCTCSPYSRGSSSP